MLDNEGNFIEESHKKKFDELNKDIDLVVGVPICAGLSGLNSAQGSKRSRGADAPQNDNMYALANIALDWIKPKVYVFENAPALFSKTGAHVVDRLNEIAEEHGYTTSLYKTNTFLHGIPQNRFRTFMYFYKKDKIDTVPIMPFYKADTPDLKTYLAQMPKGLKHDVYDENTSAVRSYFIDFMKHINKPNWREVIYEHSNNKTTSIMKYIFDNNLQDEMLSFFESYEFKSDRERERVLTLVKRRIEKVKQGMGYWDMSPVLPTPGATPGIISKNNATVFHPEEDRLLTYREQMHLMGLPNDFNLNDEKTFNYNHISQNVPVCTAKDIITNVVKYLNGECPIIDTKHIRQDNINETTEYTIINNLNDELF